MKNVAYKQIGPIVICYYNSDAPTPEDHQESIEFFRKLNFDYVRVLAISEGGSPSTVQRKEFNDALKGHEIPLAVVTDSMFVRGTLTAYSWFNRNVKAFSRDNLDGALSYLKVPDTQHQKFLNEVSLLQEQVRGRGGRTPGSTRPPSSSRAPGSTRGSNSTRG